jgi:uncharacterized protein (TIGR03084 family)
VKALAQDFLDETTALADLIRPLPARAFDARTAFKSWTITVILRHLHVWNLAAGLSLSGDGSFERYYGKVSETLKSGGSMADFELAYAGALEDHALLEALEANAKALAQTFAQCDPAQRVRWAGPDMSARSSLTARLMETWAHAQAVYDVLGRVRQETDRIRNIVVLGNNTYDWTFRVRSRVSPGPRPHLRLESPSGETWTFNDADPANMIEGKAAEFCQVVTQTRNIADTSLRVVGPIAADWMGNAQCFAGAASAPPAPGSRMRALTAPVF